MIAIVFGLPGSGKTYFATRLAKRLGWEYLGSDRLRKQLFTIIGYSPLEKNEVYQEMLIRMKKLAEQKRNVVIDACFNMEKSRQLFIREADKIFFIEVKASESLIRARLDQLRIDSEADFEVYNQIKMQWEAMETPHLLLVSTETNIETMLNQATEFLKLSHDQ